jgi:hypothetical protein
MGVVVEDALGKLIGVCSFKQAPVPIRAGRLIGNAHCVHMLATDRLYHGKRLEDGSRPGDVLLRGALEHIETACDGDMPFVWALVSPDNDRSRALFTRHGFGKMAYSGEGEIIHIRSPHKRLPIVALRRPRLDRNRLVRRLAPRTGNGHEPERSPRRTAP